MTSSLYCNAQNCPSWKPQFVRLFDISEYRWLLNSTRRLLYVYDCLFNFAVQGVRGKQVLLGSVICLPINGTDTFRPTILEMVDGQQIPTMLSLFLCALYTKLKNLCGQSYELASRKRAVGACRDTPPGKPVFSIFISILGGQRPNI